MSLGLGPRFGIWAPYRGKWVIDASRERLDANFDQARETVLSAERAGFDTVLFAQHTINPIDPLEEILEAWTAAAAAAALTESIEIIAAIKPLLYHPVVLAKMMLGVEDVSHGRFAINVVNAWFKPELERSGIGFPPHEQRYVYGREWLSVVKALASGERVTHRGRYFQIDDYVLRPSSRFRDRPRIYTGGESADGIAMAADSADCWLINGRPIADVLPLLEAARAQARTGPPLAFGITGFSLTRPTDQEAQAELQRLYGLQDAFYADRRRDMQKNIDPESVALKSASRYTGVKPIGANGGVLPGFVGDYDTVAGRIAAFYEAGLQTFLLSFFPLVEEQERFAAEVIPRVRRLVGASPRLARRA